MPATAAASCSAAAGHSRASLRSLAACWAAASCCRRQAGQRRRVVDVQRAGLGGGEQLLAEAVCSVLRRLLIALSCACLAGGQLGARVHELLVIDVEQLRLLGVEVQLGLLVVQRLEALEQLGVEIDEVVVRGEQRRGLGVGRLQRVVGVGAVDRAERQVGALEQQARTAPSRRRYCRTSARAFWLAIAVTSRFCCAMPASSAGR